MSDTTILLPCAGRSSRFPGTRPKWMLSAPDGELMLARALKSAGAPDGARTVVAILREHEETYCASDGIRKALGDHVEIIIFDEPTRGPADTVREMILRANVQGSILIKDSDSWFTNVGNLGTNSICVADLRKNLYVSHVGAKSFVIVNKDMIVSSIAEKNVVSNFISAGGYGFENAQVFLECFDDVLKIDSVVELFVSHVILQAMIKQEVFIAHEVEEYIDVGTLENWMAYRKDHATYFIDIDGVVFQNRGEYFPPLWSEPDEAIEKNVKSLLSLQKNGAQFVFLTARNSDMRKKTEAKLKKLGFHWHAVIMECHHGRRFMVNDFAATNPYPSAVGINLPRNSDRLEELL